MEGCVLGKMTILEGGGREEKDSSLDIIIQVKSVLSGLEGSRRNRRPWKGRSGLGSVRVWDLHSDTNCILSCRCFPFFSSSSLLFWVSGAVLSGPQTGSISTSSGRRASPRLPVLWGVGTWVGV